jgi:hypothetical protein
MKSKNKQISMRHLEEVTKKMKTLKYGRPFLFYSLSLTPNYIPMQEITISKHSPRERGTFEDIRVSKRIEKNYEVAVGVKLKIRE